MPKRQCKYLDTYGKEYPFMKKGRTENEAYYMYCNCYLSIGHGRIVDLRDHINSQKYKSFVASSGKCTSIKSYFTKLDSSEEDKITAAKLCFAYHIIKQHQSFVSSDCMNKLIRKAFDDSKIAIKYASARTKKTSMINQILA